MELHFMRPQWLWTLAPACILLLALWRQRGSGGGWQAVIAPDLLRHLVKERASAHGGKLLPLVLLGWLLAAVAASGPSWQKIPLPVHQKQDALVVILDLSYSMKAADLAPSRLDRVRQKLLDLLQQRNEGQTALVAYAGDAHIVTPLTDDRPTIANLLPALNPDMMPLPGSDPVSAVKMALDLLRSAGVRQGRILLATDGVSDRDRRGIEAAVAGSDTTLSVLGVGTPAGAPIPLPQGGFLKNENGAIVLPGLDEQNLRSLASEAGGIYRRIQVDDGDLEALLADTPLQETGATLALERTADTWEDQGYLLILPLLPLVLGLFRRGWLLGLVPLMLLAQPRPALALSWEDLWFTPDQQGRHALERGDNEAAAALFNNPDWAGTAAYRNGDYESAIEHFDDTDSADRLYNRGNALARAGKLEQAIAAYEQSLALQPDRQDAEENLDLLKKLRDQQQEQQSQEQQNQNPQQDQGQQGDQEQQNQDQQQDPDQQQAQGQQQDQEQRNQDQQQGQGQQQNQKQQQQSQDQQRDQDQQQDQEQQNQEQQQEREHQQSQAQQGQDQETEPGREHPREERQEASGPEEQDLQKAPGDETEDAERDQATEQWLRRVPDDPSGLLREKFRYESRQRQQEGDHQPDESFW